MVKILAFSGSSRKESYNQKLVKIAAKGAERAGAQVSVINLEDFPMPLFNQDFELEQGMPKAARDFKQLLIDHDGFLIASPEYNSAFSPLLKNAIDWASRREDDELPLLAYRGKFAAIMSASPGVLGGLRGLAFLRLVLSNIGVTVLATQQAVAQADKSFDADGDLVSEKMQEDILNLGKELTEILYKLKK